MTTALTNSPEQGTGRVRIAIVDDHPLFLDGMQSWLTESAQCLDVVVAVASWTELLAHPEHPAQVVLLDVDLGDEVPLAVKIRALGSAGSNVVVVSTHADATTVRRALEAGALGYVPKSSHSEELIETIHAAARGEGHVTSHLAKMLLDDPAPSRPSLSPQERRALCLYASDLPLKSVARQMSVAEETAKSYLNRVRQKYADAGREARTKLELHRRAVQDGWIED